MNKKAFELSWAVGLAIAVLVLIVVVVFIGKSTTFIGEKAKDTMCRKSVEESVRLDTGIIAKSLDYAEIINCPTHYLTVDTSNSDEANKAIAEEIRKCWWQMGEGKLTLFQHSDAVFCVVCSVIEKWTGEKPVTGLDTWLAKNNMPGTKDTYLWYLTGTKGTYTDYVKTTEIETPGTGSFQSLGKIDTSKPYAVLFVYTKEAFEWDATTQKRKLRQTGISLWSAVKYRVASVFGWTESSKYTARVVLVPYDTSTLASEMKCQVLMD